MEENGALCPLAIPFSALLADDRDFCRHHRCDDRAYVFRVSLTLHFGIKYIHLSFLLQRWEGRTFFVVLRPISPHHTTYTNVATHFDARSTGFRAVFDDQREGRISKSGVPVRWPN